MCLYNCTDDRSLNVAMHTLPSHLTSVHMYSKITINEVNLPVVHRKITINEVNVKFYLNKAIATLVDTFHFFQQRM